VFGIVRTVAGVVFLTAVLLMPTQIFQCEICINLSFTPAPPPFKSDALKNNALEKRDMNSPYDPKKEFVYEGGIDAPELDTTNHHTEHTLHNDIPGYEKLLRNKSRQQYTSERHYEDVRYLLNLITHIRGY
jgi:hypothetical protein